MLPSLFAITQKLTAWFFCRFQILLPRTCELWLPSFIFQSYELTMMWTPQQKAFCVLQYISAGSFLEAQRPCPLTHLISTLLTSSCDGTSSIEFLPTTHSQSMIWTQKLGVKLARFLDRCNTTSWGTAGLPWSQWWSLVTCDKAQKWQGRALLTHLIGVYTVIVDIYS